MSRKFALIIGNSEYEDTKLARLVTPGADVSALAKVLRAPEIGGFDEVTLLVDQMESVVRRAIARFFAQKGRDDLLLLYFSGHGVLDDQGQLYLAMKDTEHDLLSATGIPAALITREMDNSLPRRQVLILDCCHSGAFARGAKGTPGASVGTAAAFEGNGYGRVVLTATDSTQYAWEGNEIIGQAENSVFTHYLVQGLQTGEADADADGHITLDELYNYVYERMVNATRRQTPGKWSYKQQGEIALAKNPRPVVKPVALPPELQHALESPFAAVREGVVRELDRLWRGSDPGLALAARTALESLKEDDSRRVSAAAAESLSTHTTSQPPRAEPAEPVVKAEVDALRTGSPAASGKRPAQGLAEPGDTKRPQATSEPRRDTTIRVDVPARTIWGPLLLTVIGWAIAGYIGGVISMEIVRDLGWAISFAIGGSILGLTTRMAEPAIPPKSVGMVVIGWAIPGGIGWIISLVIGLPIGWAIYFAIGGVSTGLVLRWAGPSMQWQQVIAVIVGWVVAGYIGAMAVGAIDYHPNWPIGRAISGAIAGAVGGGVMFWQLNSARARA
jgi:hypothetical protein